MRVSNLIFGGIDWSHSELEISEWKGAFCGNKIVEEGEECDCGYDNEECDEKCCYPRVVSESDKLINPEAQGCKRRPSKFHFLLHSDLMSDERKLHVSTRQLHLNRWIITRKLNWISSNRNPM